MITEARISHYKSVADATLTFGRQNILVGPNGVGKSNVVDALYFVHDCIANDLDTAVVKRHGIESIRQWSKTRPYNIGLDLQFKNVHGTGRYRFTLSSRKGAYTVVEEQGEWTGRDPLHRSDTPTTRRFQRLQTGRVKIQPGHDHKHVPNEAKVDPAELFLTSIAGPVTYLYILFEDLISEIRSFTAYSIYPNTLRQPQVVSRQEVLQADGANLATILKNIHTKNKRAKNALISSLRIVMPQITDVNVESAGGFYVPVMRVRESNGEIHPFNMSQVSDGTLRVLGLLTAFYQPAVPGIIAVEEPEQMIHPGVLPVIADAAKEYSALRTNQVFITTHSPTLLDLFDPETIIWTSLRDGITACGPITSRQLGLIKRQLFTAGEILVSEGFFG